jgi:hypothetical protein
MPSPQRRFVDSTDADTLVVLEQTYPAWHIRRTRHGMWSATRATAPTLLQAEAGLHQFIVQPTARALSAILAQQLDIVQRVRF